MKSTTLTVTTAALLGALGTPASAQVWINDFAPNPWGSDPLTQLIELRGRPGDTFSGSFISIGTDTPSPFISSTQAVSGSFDANGLLTFSLPDLRNPSITVALLNGAAPTVGSTPDIASLSAITLDAIGVPDSAIDQTYQLGAALGGTDFLYTGDEPKRVFRDGNRPNVIWAVNDPARNEAIDQFGNVVEFSSFVSGNPDFANFGGVNPSAFLPVTPKINEFEPNPFGSDGSTQRVELIGNPGEFFSGSIITIDTDTDTPTIDRATNVAGTFGLNGVLTFSVPDFENPSFTIALLDDSVDPTDDLGQLFVLADYVDAALDAIGVPDSSLDEARQLGAALGGTDFVYTGDEPKLIFRDRNDPNRLWALNDPTTGVAIDQFGNEVDLDDFQLGNPGIDTFGTGNAALVPEPNSLALFGLGGLMIARRRR
jgi:hypothetical protein